MHHAAHITTDTVVGMTVGLYLVIQFGYYGCRLLDNGIGGIGELNLLEKTTAAGCWALVLGGIDVLAITTPWAQWGAAAILVANVGIVLLLIGTLLMVWHIDHSANAFPVKAYCFDLAIFGAGFAITWMASWL